MAGKLHAHSNSKPCWVSSRHFLGTVAAIVVAQQVIKGQTMHLSAMASVLCSAAMVHPRDSQAARASSVACKSEVGPDRSRQRGSWTLAMSAVRIRG